MRFLEEKKKAKEHKAQRVSKVKAKLQKKRSLM